MFISGGIDSSIIAAFLCKINERFKTFSLSDNPYDVDIKDLHMLSEYLGTEHHEFIITEDEGISEIPNFIWHYEGIDYPGMFFTFFQKNHQALLIVFYADRVLMKCSPGMTDIKI